MPKNLKQLRTNSSGAIFEVSYAFKDEVINLAKMWLPAIRILEPKELQTHLENLLKTYLQKAKRQIL